MNVYKDIKKYGNENDIPITLDESLETILNILQTENSKTVLEIGTAIGYGAINIASLNTVELVETVEKDVERFNIANKNIKENNLEDKIKTHNLDAKDFIECLVKKNRKFDFIYLDGPKGQYIAYYENLKKLVISGGIIVADNLFFHGMVEGKIETPKSCKTMIKKLKQFIEFVKQDNEVSFEILNVGDGLGVIRKK